MFACCTKKDTSLEGALLEELTELNHRMSKILKQLNYLRPSEYLSDRDRYNAPLAIYQQIPLSALVRTRGYSAPPRLESVSVDTTESQDEDMEISTSENMVLHTESAKTVKTGKSEDQDVVETTEV